MAGEIAAIRKEYHELKEINPAKAEALLHDMEKELGPCVVAEVRKPPERRTKKAAPPKADTTPYCNERPSLKKEANKKKAIHIHEMGTNHSRHILGRTWCGIEYAPNKDIKTWSWEQEELPTCKLCIGRLRVIVKNREPGEDLQELMLLEKINKRDEENATQSPQDD